MASPPEAAECFRLVPGQASEDDTWFLAVAAHQLLAFENERGDLAADCVHTLLRAHIGPIVGRSQVRRWTGHWSLRRAHHQHRAGRAQHVSRHVWRAVREQPRYLFDRDVVALLAGAYVGPLRTGS